MGRQLGTLQWALLLSLGLVTGYLLGTASLLETLESQELDPCFPRAAPEAPGEGFQSRVHTRTGTHPQVGSAQPGASEI
jgi:hypothetical protein